jgi:prophage endopeptidase
MIGLLGWFKFVPSWVYWLVIVIGTAYACDLYGQHVIEARWDAAKLAQSILNKEVIDRRAEDNTLLKKVQIGTSEKIQRTHDNEIATLTTQLANSQRLRIGTAICPSVARQANTHSASSGNEAYTTARLLPPEVDAAIKQLIMESEDAAATGRAAQEFINKNGMAPK